MLCTSCSNQVRPLVAVDIDGTLGDYHGHFSQFASDYLAVRPTTPPYDGRWDHRVWFMRAFGTDTRTFRDVKLAYRQGGLKRWMPIYAGAKRLLDGLFALDVEVFLTTTRPYLRLDGIDPDTRFWLAREDLHYDGLLYHEDKYEVLRENIDPDRVVAIFDDLPEQIYAAAVAFEDPQRAILVHNYSNRGAKLPAITVDSLSGALEIATQRVAEWRSR